MQQLTHSGYFEGLGGFSLGAEWSGIQTVHTVEIEPHLHEFLKVKFPNATHETDILSATGRAADIFTGGFPCQDISNANPKGKGIKGERSGLVHAFLRHVGIFRPTYFVLENSPNLLNRGFGELLGEISRLGYNAEWQVIQKTSFGFPDIRKRLFLVAYTHEVGRQTNSRVFEPIVVNQCRESLARRFDLFNQSSGTTPVSVWEKAIGDLCREDDGIPCKLVHETNAIKAFGNSVCPHITHLVFELIKIHYSQFNFSKNGNQIPKVKSKATKGRASHQ